MWEFAKSFRTSERSWELRKTIIAFSVLDLFGIHCHLRHILAVLLVSNRCVFYVNVLVCIVCTDKPLQLVGLVSSDRSLWIRTLTAASVSRQARNVRCLRWSLYFQNLPPKSLTWTKWLCRTSNEQCRYRGINVQPLRGDAGFQQWHLSKRFHLIPLYHPSKENRKTKGFKL